MLISIKDNNLDIKPGLFPRAETCLQRSYCYNNDTQLTPMEFTCKDDPNFVLQKACPFMPNIDQETYVITFNSSEPNVLNPEFQIIVFTHPVFDDVVFESSIIKPTDSEIQVFNLWKWIIERKPPSGHYYISIRVRESGKSYWLNPNENRIVVYLDTAFKPFYLPCENPKLEFVYENSIFPSVIYCLRNKISQLTSQALIHDTENNEEIVSSEISMITGITRLSFENFGKLFDETVIENDQPIGLKQYLKKWETMNRNKIQSNTIIYRLQPLTFNPLSSKSDVTFVNTGQMTSVTRKTTFVSNKKIVGMYGRNVHFDDVESEDDYHGNLTCLEACASSKSCHVIKVRIDKDIEKNCTLLSIKKPIKVNKLVVSPNMITYLMDEDVIWKFKDPVMIRLNSPLISSKIKSFNNASKPHIFRTGTNEEVEHKKVRPSNKGTVFGETKQAKNDTEEISSDDNDLDSGSDDESSKSWTPQIQFIESLDPPFSNDFLNFSSSTIQYENSHWTFKADAVVKYGSMKTVQLGVDYARSSFCVLLYTGSHSNGFEEQLAEIINVFIPGSTILNCHRLYEEDKTVFEKSHRQQISPYEEDIALNYSLDNLMVRNLNATKVVLHEKGGEIWYTHNYTGQIDLEFRVFTAKENHCREEDETCLSLAAEIKINVNLEPECNENAISLSFNKDSYSFQKSDFVKISAILQGLETCVGVVPRPHFFWTIMKEGEPYQLPGRKETDSLEFMASPRSFEIGKYHIGLTAEVLGKNYTAEQALLTLTH